MRRGLAVALAAAAVVVAVAVTAVVWWVRRQEPQLPAPTPQLIGFSLQNRPAQGWRVTRADIGLPDEIPVGKPFGSAGDRAYFLADCDLDCGDGYRSWVYGIDLRTGTRLFDPILLEGLKGGFDGNCHLNGEYTAVCLADIDTIHGKPRQIWVLDLARGQVTHSGETDLHIRGYGPEPVVEAIGNPRGQTRLVATALRTGVYGIGATGERTWFVPGSGRLDVPTLTVSDDAPLTLATQIPTPEDPTYRVFSLIDGTERTPTPSPGATLKRAAVYPGGFAYQYEAQDVAGVLFYNAAGDLLAQRELRGYNLLDATTVPIVLDGSVLRVYSRDGRQIIEFPGPAVDYRDAKFQMIGSDLYAWQGEEGWENETWQQWSLNSGSPGTRCQVDFTHYVGSDGHIVLSTTYHGSGDEIVATDLSTCQQLWRMPAPDRRGVVEQVGTALIARNETELVGLRAE
ncbi:MULTISPECIES: hypothetical protein [unclassified Mycolicibacterium]|uniref:hypothetical protein n=1 Tax=unclassified Mycolicibacterium TaxID=2636767 RepID=UPI0012DC4DFC|nr:MULTISPECIES: hypothetical protein [unclassified Mycolicibacterium]MUL81541.1 hypothetical protein [Mycolicibacterium sp. CBMA 329]MUL87307.1 hypothetical protein [Mycolicibacterium sp. CBMA 331]MUM02594.1 hypothetical protein [Mycolicibacterium sp. CBMA 334]MUM25171.1 hypothetical protein [Mycolicibacterium sp. CBMA 295]MUM37604.1 hypothetical protein [Mycolicibacterium sp. CBMA 247]